MTIAFLLAAPVVAVAISHLLARRKIEQIRVLVNGRLSVANSRLSVALKEIKTLKKQLGVPDDE